MERGRLITLEGPDGSGKSTQAARLAAALRERGLEVVLTREPGGTQLGERVRAILLDLAGPAHSARADALLFNAARAQHVDDVIEPALARGAIVVCDRYADSTAAYQGFGSGLALQELRRIGAFATRGTQPDLTVLLDVPVGAGLIRRQSGAPDGMTRFERPEAFDEAYHERVRAGFLELARVEPSRWRVVDGDRDADAVALDVLAVAETFLGVAREATVEP